MTDSQPESAMLRAMISAFWLRPMTAITRYLEASWFDFETAFAGLDADVVEAGGSPRAGGLDLACGDGLFTAVATGRPLPIHYAAYRSVATDYSDPLDNAVPDYFDIPPYPGVGGGTELPPWKSPWKLGMDKKPNLLAKARALGVYSQTRQFDFQSFSFPSHENYSLAFSNAIYWSEDVEAVLKTIRGVLLTSESPNLFLSLQLSRAQETLAGNLSWLQGLGTRLDGGRRFHVKTSMTADQWLATLEQVGFVVQEYSFTMNRNLALANEWLDLREYYLFFASLSRAVEVATLRDVKTKFIKHVESLFLEAQTHDLLTADEKNGHFLLVKAKKCED